MTTGIDETRPARLDIRHWSWRRMMFALLLLFPLFGFIAWMIADIDLHQKVNRRLEEYRSQGVPVSRDQIAVEIVPDDENQIFFIQRAMEALQISQGEAAQLETYPPPKIEENLDFYNALIAQNEPVFEHLAEAQTRQRASWNQELESPNWPDMRLGWRLSQLLEVSARVAAFKGDYRTAMVRLEQMRNSASALNNHPTYVGHMQASARKQLVCDVVISISEKISIADENTGSAATREQVARMIEWLLDDDEHRKATAEHYRRMRVYAITSTQAEAQKRRLTRFRYDGQTLRMMNKFDVAERTALHQTLPEAMKELPPDREENPQIIKDFDLPIEGGVQFDFQTLTKKRVAAIALAMAVYRAHHQGAWPASLEELVPEYLPRVPDDPMAHPAKPFTFLSDRYLIYSVGLDGVDDGGSDRPSVPRAYSTNGQLNEWQRRDVLFYLAPSLAKDDPEEETNE